MHGLKENLCLLLLPHLRCHLHRSKHHPQRKCPQWSKLLSIGRRSEFERDRGHLGFRNVPGHFKIFPIGTTDVSSFIISNVPGPVCYFRMLFKIYPIDAQAIAHPKNFWLKLAIWKVLCEAFHRLPDKSLAHRGSWSDHPWKKMEMKNTVGSWLIISGSTYRFHTYKEKRNCQQFLQ